VCHCDGPEKVAREREEAISFSGSCFDDEIASALTHRSSQKPRNGGLVSIVMLLFGTNFFELLPQEDNSFRMHHSCIFVLLGNAKNLY